MSMFDFMSLPVIDSHAHPFNPGREKTPFARGFTGNQDPASANDLQYLTSYRMVLQEFKRLFNMPNASEEELLAKREELAKGNYKEYVRMLFDECKITALLSDYGFPISAKLKLTPEELREFNGVADGIFDVYDIIRVETSCDRLFKKGMTLEDLETALDNYIGEHIKKRKTVGLKSVIGYYTGLDIKQVSRDEASNAFYAYFYTNPNDQKANKIFRDYMFFKAMELCVKYDLTLQVHTGQGDPPMTDLRTMNPIVMYDVFNSDLGHKTRIVLIHAGIPFGAETACIVQTYTNVFMDISCLSAFEGAYLEQMFPGILDLCPHNKLMYGTDVGGLVDEAWFGTMYFKRYLAEELERRVLKNQFTKEYAEQIAEMILSENCKRIYKMDRAFDLQ